MSRFVQWCRGVPAFEPWYKTYKMSECRFQGSDPTTLYKAERDNGKVGENIHRYPMFLTSLEC